MKSKIRNLLKDQYRPESRSYERISYNRVKTRYSIDQETDEPVWNKSFKNVQPFTTKYQVGTNIYNVMRENEELKHQVTKLKNQLSKYESDHHMSKNSLKSIQEQHYEDSAHLKQILQKSYYSLREMEKDINRLKNQLVLEKKSHHNTERKLKLAAFQKEELEKKITNMMEVHKEQIRICNVRINKLEGHLSQLIDHMEYDHKEWKKHMEDLKNFKKFSFKRTYQ